MSKKWTDEEITFIKENYINMTDHQIGIALKRSDSSVKSKRQELGFEKDKAHRKYTFQDVIDTFSKTNYTLVSESNDYINAAENTLKYICPKHKDKGIMTIALGHLLEGRGCKYCAREVVGQAHIIPHTQLEKECKNIAESKGFEYITYKKDNGKVYIGYVCPNHKELGVQYMTKGNMNRENITACPYCFENKKFKFSKGEMKVEKYLSENNIPYIKQYSFKECRDQNTLPFDFYLINNNTCIEYDGEHHYYPVTFNGVSEEQAIINHDNTIKHDRIKNQFCKDNGIDLIRIPYFEFNNIEKILRERIIA